MSRANYFSQFIVRLVGGALLALGVLAVLATEDFRIALAFGGFTTLFLVVHTLGQRLAVPHWRTNREAIAGLSGYLGERIAGLKDIQTNGGTAYTIARFHSAARRVFWSFFRAEAIAEASWQLSNVVFGLGLAGALALGVLQFQADAITIGTVYLLVHYLELLRTPLRSISSEIENLQKARVSIDRVLGILNAVSTIRDGVGSSLPSENLAIRFDGVSFEYNVDSWVLRDVSLVVEPRQVLGLVGRTGSGKTTMERLMVRLHDPQKGVITLGGADITKVPLRELRRSIGFVPQDIELVHGSIRENIALYDPRIYDATIRRAITSLGLDHWLASLPKGLDTVIAAAGDRLSAGEAQLLAFTRVYLSNPHIVILDEASSRLDPITERALDGALTGLFAGRTGIIIAHRLSTLDRVDKIEVLEDGVLSEYGSAEELAGSSGSSLHRLFATDGGEAPE
jgi:ATP-binding cassette subfamily B protein